MLLKSITINNIRSYNHAKIDLRNGSTLLLGDIGSGKTTILLAIEFVLFGLIKGDVSGSTLLRHGKNEGSVELDFSIGKDEIKIHRKLKRKKYITRANGSESLSTKANKRRVSNFR